MIPNMTTKQKNEYRYWKKTFRLVEPVSSDLHIFRKTITLTLDQLRMLKSRYAK